MTPGAESASSLYWKRDMYRDVYCPIKLVRAVDRPMLVVSLPASLVGAVIEAVSHSTCVFFAT